MQLTTATTAAKTVGTSAGQFEGDAMSIAFNVNDDLINFLRRS